MKKSRANNDDSAKLSSITREWDDHIAANQYNDPDAIGVARVVQPESERQRIENGLARRFGRRARRFDI